VTEIVTLIVFATAAAVYWCFAKPPAAFVVRVRADNAEVTAGSVTSAFLVEVAGVCREFAILNGEVRGVVRGQRISLRFSDTFPPTARQRLRNWWAQSGWPPPRRKPPRH
jgi:hypothetical protein